MEKTIRTILIAGIMLSLALMPVSGAAAQGSSPGQDHTS